jgi:hypothetical protein
MQDRQPTSIRGAIPGGWSVFSSAEQMAQKEVMPMPNQSQLPHLRASEGVACFVSAR